MPEHKKKEKRWLSDAWWRGFWSAFSFLPLSSARWHDPYDSQGLHVPRQNSRKPCGFDDDLGAIANDMKKVIGDLDAVLKRVKLDDGENVKCGKKEVICAEKNK